MMKISQIEKKSLLVIKDVLRWAMAQSEKITVAQVITLLEVAQKEGQKASYYIRKTGQCKATVSRHMLNMGGQLTKVYQGLGWIESRQHPKDSRALQYFLTPRGHQFVCHVEEKMEGRMNDEKKL
tara:strand:+ start:340 stop:714 length:375 start_codon:yes stop_codon:yes gene_type:complete